MKALLFSQSVLGLTPSIAAEESGVVLNPVTSFGGLWEGVLPEKYSPSGLLPGLQQRDSNAGALLWIQSR